MSKVSPHLASFWSKFSPEEIVYILRMAPKVAEWDKTPGGLVSLTAYRVVSQNMGIIAGDTKGFRGFVTPEGVSDRVKEVEKAGYKIINTPETAE